MAAFLLTAEDRDGEKALYNVDHLLELWDEIHARAPAAPALAGRRGERPRPRAVAGRDDIVALRPAPARAGARAPPRTSTSRSTRARRTRGSRPPRSAEYMGLGVPTVSYDYEVTEELRETGAGVLVTDAARVRRRRRAPGRRTPQRAARSRPPQRRPGAERNWDVARAPLRGRDPRPLPPLSLRVSAIIPNKNGAGLVGRCVAAARTRGRRRGDRRRRRVDRRQPGRGGGRGRRAGPSAGRGFAAAVNTGVRTRRGDALLILNSDCFLAPDAMRGMTGALAADPRIGDRGGGAHRDRRHAQQVGRLPALTPWLSIRDGPVVDAVIPRPRARGEHVDAVPLACALVRRQAGTSRRARRALLLLLRGPRPLPPPPRVRVEGRRRLEGTGLRTSAATSSRSGTSNAGSSSSRAAERSTSASTSRSAGSSFCGGLGPGRPAQVCAVGHAPEAYAGGWARTWWRAAWAGVNG